MSRDSTVGEISHGGQGAAQTSTYLQNTNGSMNNVHTMTTFDEAPTTIEPKFVSVRSPA